MLKTYLNVLQEKRAVPDDKKSTIKSHLKLSGVVKSEKGNLKVRNLIYKKAFTQKWAKSYLANYRPDIRFTVSGTVLATLLIVIARFLGIFQQFELATYDAFLRLRPSESLDERITIVKVTEEDILRESLLQENDSKYSISDQSLLKLLQQIDQYQPRVIGFEFYRPSIDEPQLNQLIQSLDNLVFVDSLSPDFASTPPVNVVPMERIGFSDIILDQDGFTRRSLLGASSNGGSTVSFALRIALLYLVQDLNLEWEWDIGNNRDVLRLGTVDLPRIQPNSGVYFGADAAGFQTLINFRRGSTPFSSVNYSDTLTGNVSENLFKDRVVLIGAIARSTSDLFNTATRDGQIAGVELHAHQISQILSAVLDGRPLIKTFSSSGEVFIIVFCSLMGGAVAWYFQNPRHFLVVIFLIGGSLVVVSSSALTYLSYWLPLVPSATGFIFTTTAISFLSLRQRNLEKDIQERLK